MILKLIHVRMRSQYISLRMDLMRSRRRAPITSHARQFVSVMLVYFVILNITAFLDAALTRMDVSTMCDWVKVPTTVPSHDKCISFYPWNKCRSIRSLAVSVRGPTGSFTTGIWALYDRSSSNFDKLKLHRCKHYYCYQVGSGICHWTLPGIYLHAGEYNRSLRSQVFMGAI